MRADLTGWVALFLFAGLACALPLARSLNLLALGEEPAQQLGVDVARVQRVLLVAASLMVGAAVSVAGLVGFVGPDHPAPAAAADRTRSPAAGALGRARRRRLPAACATPRRARLLGGRELPVGALTSLAGGPVFLWLLRRHQQRTFAP